MSFVLASASAQRITLLKQVFLVPHTVFPCDVDESVLPHETPKEYVKRVAHAKANFALSHYPHDIILAADTIVVMGRRIFQKPASLEEAQAMLKQFSGRRQQVYSYVVVKNANKTRERLVTTRLSFKRLSHKDLEDSANAGEWRHASGGICMEKFAAKFIKSINGSFSNVLGLPLLEACNLLESFNIRSDVHITH